MSMSDEIEKLHRLHGQGALTDEEFALAKKRLIDGIQSHAQPGRPQAEPQRSGNGPLHEFRLTNQDRWIAGVCGGLAELTRIPAWSWRVLFVLTGLLHGLGVLMYILLWIFVPRRALPIAAPLPTAAGAGNSADGQSKPPAGEA